MADTTNEQPPGGSWNERHPTFHKSVNALFLKGVLIKLRTITVFVEEFIACALIGILAILMNFATNTYADNPHPLLNPPTNLSAAANGFLGRGGSLFRAVKDSEGRVEASIKKFFGPDPDEQLPVMKELRALNLAERFKYVENFDKVKDDLYSTDNYGVGFEWYNADKDNYSAKPDFTLAEQSSIVSLSIPMIGMMTKELYMRFYSDLLYQDDQGYHLNTTFLGSILLESCSSFGAEQRKCMGVLGLLSQYILPEVGPYLPQLTMDDLTVKPTTSPEISNAPYPVPEFKAELPLGIAVAFFSSMQCIIASMPDTAQILDEKDMHLQTLMFLMGCSETAYWLVNFLSAFMMCFVAYVVIISCYAFGFGMKGTNFLMMLVLAVLFIIAEIWFQFFLLAFMKHTTGGRIMNIILLVLSIFFGYVNEVYTLQPASPESVKHVFSIFPISCFEMVMVTMYNEVRNKRAPCTWSDMNSDRFTYKIWWAFMWLSVDAVAYFLLFLIFNAMNPRPFGAPPIGWKEFCNKNSWKRAFGLGESAFKMNEESENIIEVQDLTKIYKGAHGVQKLAVNHINFAIKKGEVIVMIGPNGAGKSSILNTLSGALPINSGTLSLYGDTPQTNFKNIQNIMGIVFQDNVLFPKLSVREHLKIFGAFRGIENQVLEDATQFFAETLQLEEMLKNRAGDLSGGQKRKLCLALSLLGNPPIVVMDEPTAGVDVQARQLIWKVISTLKSSTSIVTTHALEEAEAVSSRLFVVSHGNLAFMGTSTEFREQYQCGYVLKINTESDDISDIVKLAQKYDSHAQMMPDRQDTILLPVSGQIPKFLHELEESKESLNVDSYTFSVEQLEDVLLRILESGA